MTGQPAKLERRVVDAADAVVAERQFVAPVDLLCRIGWLHPVHVEQWRSGRLPDLERMLPVSLDTVSEALGYLKAWAREHGMTASEAAYLAPSRDRRHLHFTASGDGALESAVRTYWISSQMPESKRTRLTQRQNKAPDLVAILPLHEFTCAECGGTGEWLVMERDEPLCLRCADMDHLVFLPSGDAALTRRAKKVSGLAAVVVRFSRSRKRYERQGTLVEEAALAEAEQQCLADADARERKRERNRERRSAQDVAFVHELGTRILELYPRCPGERAEAIAAYAGSRGSGRVGRSAAGRALDERAVRAAVVASVRHQDTRYDELLMSGVARGEAREQVRSAIEATLAYWS